MVAAPAVGGVAAAYLNQAVMLRPISDACDAVLDHTPDPAHRPVHRSAAAPVTESDAAWATEKAAAADPAVRTLLRAGSLDPFG